MTTKPEFFCALGWYLFGGVILLGLSLIGWIIEKGKKK